MFNIINQISSRNFFLISIIAVIIIWIAALILQYGFNLPPCPLCYLQRGSLTLFGLIAILAYIFNPKSIGQKIYAFFSLLALISGMIFAGRHIYLERLPAELKPTCSADVNYLLEILPITKVFSLVFEGSAECAAIAWSFFGFTLPEMAMVCFIALSILMIIVLFKK